MKNRILLFVAILVAGSVFLVGAGILPASAANTDDETGYRSITVFTRALQLIRQDYVDGEKISYRDLTYDALRGMLSGLDPHSQFMAPRDFEDMQDDTRGEFGGIGVVVSMKDGVLTVVSPMEDTPGFKVGMLPGDQIIKINGTSTEHMDLVDAVGELRGEAGKSVTITVLRPSSKDIIDFDIVRAIIPVESVKGGEILDPELTGGFKIGYIRITQFNEPTAEDLGLELDRLEAEGMEALVLDLRFNPGGLLKSAKDVCAQFLDPGEMVVYTEGRMPSQKRVYRTPSKYVPRKKFPLAILINNGSASGSEIVAGALKDLNRAVLVGETTFGKGSVQQVVQLPDGSALRLTTAKYYTPSKQVIHERGVAPQIRVTLTPSQDRDILMLRRMDVLPPEEAERLKDVRDVQLERAVDALKGFAIFGGKDPGQDATVKKAEPVASAN